MARPRSFEPDEVLDLAMQLFWQKGYEATSVQDLEAAMGINRYSLYNTFGDKHQLYLACLDRYRDRMVAEMTCGLEHGSEGLQAIRDFMNAFRGKAPDAMGRGCFMVNCAVEQSHDDPEAASRILAHAERLEAAFLAALTRARASGELGSEHDLDDLARYLVVATNGILVGVRMRQPLDALDAGLRMIVSQVDAWEQVA